MKKGVIQCGAAISGAAILAAAGWKPAPHCAPLPVRAPFVHSCFPHSTPTPQKTDSEKVLGKAERILMLESNE
jgi:hypothetical protein